MQFSLAPTPGLLHTRFFSLLISKVGVFKLRMLFSGVLLGHCSARHRGSGHSSNPGECGRPESIATATTAGGDGSRGGSGIEAGSGTIMAGILGLPLGRCAICSPSTAGESEALEMNRIGIGQVGLLDIILAKEATMAVVIMLEVMVLLQRGRQGWGR